MTARWQRLMVGAAALLAALALATSSAAAQEPTSRPAKVKAGATKATHPAKNKAKASTNIKTVDSRSELRSQASQMAAGVQAAEAALGPDELAIAEQVHTGTLPCELGASVTLLSDAKSPGYFDLRGKNFKFRLMPVVSHTGAIRLEDRQAGAVWLQLANKSMLMNQKAGRRMADDCMSPGQALQAQALKHSPAVSFLDTPAR